MLGSNEQLPQFTDINLKESLNYKFFSIERLRKIR